MATAGIARSGAVMAAGTLGVLALARIQAGEATAMTMAFTTFVLFQLCNAINARAGRGTVFHRDQLRNPVLWLALAAVLAIQVTVVYLPWAQTVYDALRHLRRRHQQMALVVDEHGGVEGIITVTPSPWSACTPSATTTRTPSNRHRHRRKPCPPSRATRRPRPSSAKP